MPWFNVKNCFNDNAVVSVKWDKYRIHFWYMIKDKAINLFKKNPDLTGKGGIL